MKVTRKQCCDAIEQEVRYWNSRYQNASFLHPGRAMFLAERKYWDKRLELAMAELKDGSLDEVIDVE